MVQAPLHGAYIVWRWGDKEIEDAKLLRQQLQEIHAKGFSGVVVALWETRYEVIDHKVVVAVAQARVTPGLQIGCGRGGRGDRVQREGYGLVAAVVEWISRDVDNRACAAERHRILAVDR